MDKTDPVISFKFGVEIDGLLVAGFSEVSGLQAETELESYSEGGVNHYIHRFPKHTRYPNLVLRKGFTGSRELWNWYIKTIYGHIEPKGGSVILYTPPNLTEICRWNFTQAYPIKWIGPELKSLSTEVSVETLELVHQGLTEVR